MPHRAVHRSAQLGKAAMAAAVLVITMFGAPGSPTAVAATKDTRLIEAATSYPTKLGTAAGFFRRYPASICLERRFDADVVIYVCDKDGHPQQFVFDTAVPGLLVLTAVSLNGETPNLDGSLVQLMRELGIRTKPRGNVAPTTTVDEGTNENDDRKPSSSRASRIARRADPAEATPPFVGAWGRSEADCANQAEFQINTLIGRTRFNRDELECRITAASPIGSTFILALACAREGEEENQLARLTLDTPDRMTLELADGTKDALQRCTGPVPAEYRSALD